MYRAILPDGNVPAARYEREEHGVELYTEDDRLRAFVPYENLVALMNEAVEAEENRSIL
ncbi:MAG: hypothetical protein ACLFMX_01695 [Halobacteriales archaeon]